MCWRRSRSDSNISPVDDADRDIKADIIMDEVNVREMCRLILEDADR